MPVKELSIIWVKFDNFVSLIDKKYPVKIPNTEAISVAKPEDFKESIIISNKS